MAGRSLPWAATNGAMTSATVVSGATSVRGTVRASPSTAIVATARSARATRSRAMGRNASPAGDSRRRALRAVEQRDAQLGLQPAQLARQRRLGHRDGRRGSGHRAVVHDSQEVAQQSELQSMPHRYGMPVDEVLDGCPGAARLAHNPVPGREVRHRPEEAEAWNDPDDPSSAGRGGAAAWRSA